jgi:sugar phosphate isomerase/epimerase
MALSLSTSWNAFRHTDGNALLKEITSLGFNRVELSFNLTRSFVDTIAEAVRGKRIIVDSIHNVCPIPEHLSRSHALPDYYSLSSTIEDERHKAVFYAKRTIDTAALLGAQAVVLHCGRVAVVDRTTELIRRYEQQGPNGQDFEKLRDDMAQERARVGAPFFERALKSIDELNTYAAQRSVRLGIETRYYHREIPSFDEMVVVLNRFQGSQVGYWHDTGHAQVMENLGFNRHVDFLREFGRFMIGTHLHDVAGCRDHQAPLRGQLDFASLVSFFPPGIIKVIEAHHPSAAADIVKAREYMETLFHE